MNKTPLQLVMQKVRHRIVQLLSYGYAHAGELTIQLSAEFGISQPTVSHHLRALRDAGIVTVVPDQTMRYYSLSDWAFEDLVDEVDLLKRRWELRDQPLRQFPLTGDNLLRSPRRMQQESARSPPVRRHVAQQLRVVGPDIGPMLRRTRLDHR